MEPDVKAARDRINAFLDAYEDPAEGRGAISTLRTEGLRLTPLDLRLVLAALDQQPDNVLPFPARPAVNANADCPCGAPAAGVAGYKGEAAPELQCVKCATADPRSMVMWRPFSVIGP